MLKGMNILITGASSTIGEAIIKEFSPSNSIYIITRKKKKSKFYDLEENNNLLDAKIVKIIENDLGDGINKELKEVVQKDFDLFFNIASSTSSLIDNQISFSNHQYHTMVDLTTPLIILDKILKNKIKNKIEKPLNMVFINSILTKINSDNHKIYTSYKVLQSEYINSVKVKYKNKFNFLNVYIASRINRDSQSKLTNKIAKLVYKALNDNKNVITFGLAGKIILVAYKFHPLIAKFLIRISRLRKLSTM